jgi:hypothetical protein
MGRRGLPTRRRPVTPTRTGRGNWYGWGKRVTDAVSGESIPKRLAIPQRGGMVDSRWSEGSRDWVDPIDRKHQPPAALPTPDPFWRVYDGAAYWLTADEDERDAALVDAGDRWDLLGYAYPDGDEEDGLTVLYRLYISAITNYLFTTSAAERTTALGLGYVEQTPSVGLYVFTEAAKNRRPVYRALHTSNRHFYSIHLHEVEALGTAWTLEGIAWYVLTGRERSRT